MPSKTPPKGRPTPGRRDRSLASHRSRSRTTTKKVVWAIIALTVVAAVLVMGSGTGGNANLGTNNGGTNSVFALPLLVLSPRVRRGALVPRP